MFLRYTDLKIKLNMLAKNIIISDKWAMIMDVIVFGYDYGCNLIHRRLKRLHLAYLRAVFDIVSLVEAEVAQVVWRRSLAGLAGLRREGEVREVVSQ